MSNIVPFVFEDQEVRTVTDGNGDPWFVAMDVCAVLGLTNTSVALSSLDADEKDSLRITDAIGRQKETNIISEPGLYNLIGKSRKPTAKRFDRWVRHDVLPAIRKTGGYSMSGGIVPDGRTWGNEAGHGFIDTVKLGVRSIFEDVLNVKLKPIDDKLKRQDEKLDYLVGKKNQGRKDFAKKCVDIFLLVTVRFYDCKCPACRDTRICDENGFYGTAEMHHARGRTLNSVYDGQPLCKKCHGKATYNTEYNEFVNTTVFKQFVALVEKVTGKSKKTIVPFKNPNQGRLDL